jgi:hypothetical protein
VPAPGATPATCPCAWNVGLPVEAYWVDGSAQRVPNGVAGGWGFAGSTQHFTFKSYACNAEHDNCGGRECNDQRGPMYRVQGPPGFSCHDGGGNPCPRSDTWTLKLGSNKQRLVPGTYVATAWLRKDLMDDLGEPVEICPGAPESTTRTWTVQ